MDLDRMDTITLLHRERYLQWKHGGFRANDIISREERYEDSESVEDEISTFLCRCSRFASEDGDGTYKAAAEIYRRFLAAPNPVAYAEQFDLTLRRK